MQTRQCKDGTTELRHHLFACHHYPATCQVIQVSGQGGSRMAIMTECHFATQLCVARINDSRETKLSYKRVNCLLALVNGRSVKMAKVWSGILGSIIEQQTTTSHEQVRQI